MGIAGFFHWLGEEVAKLKLLRTMTEDAEQLKIIDELILDMEVEKENEDSK